MIQQVLTILGEAEAPSGSVEKPNAEMLCELADEAAHGGVTGVGFPRDCGERPGFDNAREGAKSR